MARFRKPDPVPFSKIIVITVIVLNVIFTCAVLYIVWTGAQEPQALVVAWFGFTTTELLALAYIKRGDQKNATATKPPDDEQY